MRATLNLEGLHCAMQIARPKPGIVVMTIEGNDTGEFGDIPFSELGQDLENSDFLDFFVDARATKAVSIEVGAKWASWLNEYRHKLNQVTMLTSSRYTQITAEFVHRYSNLGESMLVTTDERLFENVLAARLASKSLDPDYRSQYRDLN